MERRFRTAVLATLGACFVAGLIGLAGPVLGSDGRSHKVMRGDTLWDVTNQYLANPFFWPKVWQYNPHIENPHLIYPGEQVRIPSREELEQMGISAAGPRMPTVSMGATAFVGGHLVERPLFESSGFIGTPEELNWDGAIVSSWEEKNFLVDRDLVHINMGAREGIKKGDLFQILRVGKEVRHPVTRERLGKQVTVHGILQVTTTNEDLSVARIIKSYSEIEVGDKLRAYHAEPLLTSQDLSTESKSIEGMIVANTLGKDNLAVRDVVYVDVGKEDGVSVGDRFIIYRGGEPFQVSRPDALSAGITKYPPDIMGELVVLAAGATSATAVVVEELYEITPGDRVKYSPRSLPPIKKYAIN
ncbi:MAG: FlgT C-terminal domain-containing protein [bacterium]|nr:FlgT C-terminal domain-containing protein [bacterium]